MGTFGFLLPHKGTLELVRRDPLRAEFPDLSSSPCAPGIRTSRSKEYEDQIREEVAARGMEDSVLLVTDYLADDVAPDPPAGHRRDRAPLPGDRRVIERRPALHPPHRTTDHRHRSAHLR